MKIPGGWCQPAECRPAGGVRARSSSTKVAEGGSIRKARHLRRRDDVGIDRHAGGRGDGSEAVEVHRRIPKLSRLDSTLSARMTHRGRSPRPACASPIGATSRDYRFLSFGERGALSRRGEHQDVRMVGARRSGAGNNRVCGRVRVWHGGEPTLLARGLHRVPRAPGRSAIARRDRSSQVNAMRLDEWCLQRRLLHRCHSKGTTPYRKGDRHDKGTLSTV